MSCHDASDILADYELLGVSPEDDFAAIRAAWIRLVKTWHPDVWHGTQAEAVRRMLRVNDAYDRLSKRHNRTRESRRQARAAQAARPGPARREMRGGMPVLATDPSPHATVPVPEDPATPGRGSVAEADFLEARRVMRKEPEAQVVLVA